jgi:hypothetical protein
MFELLHFLQQLALVLNEKEKATCAKNALVAEINPHPDMANGVIQKIFPKLQRKFRFS